MINAYYQWLQQQQQQAQAQAQQKPNFQGAPQQQLPPQPPLGPPAPAQQRVPVPQTRGGFLARGGGFAPTPDQQQAIDRGYFEGQGKADAYANQQRQARNKGLGNMMMVLSDALGGRPIEPGVQQRQQYQQQQNEIAKKKAQYEAIMNDPNTAPATKRLLKSLGWQNMDQFLLKKYELDNAPKAKVTTGDIHVALAQKILAGGELTAEEQRTADYLNKIGVLDQLINSTIANMSISPATNATLPAGTQADPIIVADANEAEKHKGKYVSINGAVVFVD